MNHVIVTYTVTINCPHCGRRTFLRQPPIGKSTECDKCGGKSPVVDVRPAMAESQKGDSNV